MSKKNLCISEQFEFPEIQCLSWSESNFTNYNISEFKYLIIDLTSIITLPTKMEDSSIGYASDFRKQILKYEKINEAKVLYRMIEYSSGVKILPFANISKIIFNNLRNLDYQLSKRKGITTVIYILYVMRHLSLAALNLLMIMLRGLIYFNTIQSTLT